VLSVTVEISAALTVPAAIVKDESVEAWREAAYTVPVDTTFVKILLVRRFRLSKKVKLPVSELILLALTEYVDMVDVLKVTVEISLE